MRRPISIGIIGHIGAGKACLSSTELQMLKNDIETEKEVVIVDAKETKTTSLKDLIEKQYTYKITNPYKDLLTNSKVKSNKKEKKPFWKNGKLRYI